MNNTRSKNISELVINYHLNEVCNFNCTFCYSKWELNHKKAKHAPDLQPKLDLLNNLYHFFRPSNLNNPLRKIAKWDSLRINLSGGEPLLIKHIDQVINHAHSLGFKVSLITNGSLLTPILINKIAHSLFKLGFSIDSPNLETQKKIGRITKTGKYCTLRHYQTCFSQIKKLNPKIVRKINTVVNIHNYMEDFSSMIDRLAPDEWTMVQVLPFFDKKTHITEQQFYNFKNRHIKKYQHILTSENNNEYVESFILVTPDGRFYSNGNMFKSGGYFYSQPINLVGAEKAFDQINFNFNKYLERTLLAFEARERRQKLHNNHLINTNNQAFAPA